MVIQKPCKACGVWSLGIYQIEKERERDREVKHMGSASTGDTVATRRIIYITVRGALRETLFFGRN